MKNLKLATKKSGKVDRERKVLLGLVEHYIATGKPVGSHTLKEVGFSDLSSATIRNYFANLEEQGFLTQHHSSGGRTPTDKAYRLYASSYIDQDSKIGDDKEALSTDLLHAETREIASFLQQAASQLSKITQTAVFLSAPRFEQDFIMGIKLVEIDSNRCLSVILTDFGAIHPEILYIPHKLSAFTIKRIEAYFNWRLNGLNKPSNLSKEEEELAQEFYNELMLRYIVNYSNFDNEELYRTGFSSLLSYPEFHDPNILTNSLSLFENTQGMQLLLKECCKLNKLKFWIGQDLMAYSPKTTANCAILAAPYHVNKVPVGAIGLFGPVRIPYPSLIKTLDHIASSMSESLTRNLYKFKIHMRPPKQETIDLKQYEFKLIGETRRLLIEDQRVLGLKFK